MLRILLIAVAVVVLIAMLRSTLRRGRSQAERPAPPPPPADVPRVEDMVACAHCGVHLPRGEAVVAEDGTLFCGEPHRLAHVQGSPPAR